MGIRMKTYKELKQELEISDELNESRLLRKGVASIFAAKARSEGLKVERQLNSAKNLLRSRSGENSEERLERLLKGLIEMCDANISLRKQLGAMTAIIVSGQLFNERTNKQVEKLFNRQKFQRKILGNRQQN